MTDASPVMNGFRVSLDSKRRPTLPVALLEEARIDPSHELIARADGEGRIVLEDPSALLAAFQRKVLEGKADQGVAGSLADELMEDRAIDLSFFE